MYPQRVYFYIVMGDHHIVEFGALKREILLVRKRVVLSQDLACYFLSLREEIVTKCTVVVNKFAFTALAT